jgi:hypothetical protein
MSNWNRKKKAPQSPRVADGMIAELSVPSGTLLLGDPMHFYAPVRVEGIPTDTVPVRGWVIRYPEGGVRLARVGLTFRPDAPDSRRTLGEIHVDSAKVVAVDAEAHERYWQHVGPERIGHITLLDEGRVVRLLEKQFGLKTRVVNEIAAECEAPISEELEARIVAYLQTFSKYAEFPFMYFYIKTMNTVDRISEAMLQDGLWSEVVLDEASGARLLAFSSGFGDGTYEVEGLYHAGDLVGVEVEFIGPAQDELLEVFPILRY